MLTLTFYGCNSSLNGQKNYFDNRAKTTKIALNHSKIHFHNSIVKKLFLNYKKTSV